MKKFLAVIVILLLALPYLSADADMPFPDVPPTHYSYEAIAEMKERGIISGYPNGNFGPGNSVTRAEMATLICRMNGREAQPSSTGFSDVSENHWAAGYISAAAYDKIITGDNTGSFRPDDLITYEEAIKMSVMATGIASSVKPYPSDWSKAFLEIAESTGISSGLEGSSGKNTTRADAALMLYNTSKLRDKSNLILFAEHIYNNTQNIPTNASFALDLNVFLQDNSLYHKELAKASAILSMTAYDNITLNDKEGRNADAVLKLMGFNTIEAIELGNEFEDNHISKIYVGKRTVASEGKETEIIAAIVRGTDGSLKEWSSNFDIGDGTENDEYKKENHKGYDITARRITEKIRNYAQENVKANTSRVVWITGHSRGASLANICGTYLDDSGEKCFVYTFAPSMTTTSPDKGKYSFIFNFVNTDDLITYIPLSEWGFGNYGKTSRISVYKDLLPKWQEATGLKNYNFKESIVELISKISEISPSRKACYEYSREGVVSVGADSMESGEAYGKALTKTFAPQSVPYFKYEVKKAPEGSKYPYNVVFSMQPAFYMQNIAAAMAGKLNVAAFLTMPVPEYMENAYSALTATYSGGITHPHTPETYYVMAQNTTENMFGQE